MASPSATGGGSSGRRRRGLGSLFSMLQPGSGGASTPLAAAPGRQGQQQAAAADVEEDERRQQRLAKNRESAQRSRQRKKEYLELLQDKVHQTNATLESLRREHVQGAWPRLDEARRAFLAANAPVGSGNVEAYLRAFGPCAEERQALLAHECERLKGLVLPAPARFWVWLAQQPDAFFSAATEGGLPSPSSSSSSLSALASGATPTPASAAPASSAAKAGERMMQEGTQSCGMGAELWPLLCFELQLKAEQEAALRRMGSAQGAGPPREELLGSGELEEMATTLAEVEALEAELQGAAQILEAKLRALHQVLTPAQARTLELALASS